MGRANCVTPGGLGDAVSGEEMIEESSAGAGVSGSAGRGVRTVSSEGVSRRVETWADMDDALLGSVEVGVDGSDTS